MKTTHLNCSMTQIDVLIKINLVPKINNVQFKQCIYWTLDIEENYWIYSGIRT